VIGFARALLGKDNTSRRPEVKFRPRIDVLEDRSVPSMTPTATPATATDNTYLVAAAAADEIDIVAGVLAAAKGSSTAVRQFGMNLATAHASELKQLQPILMTNGLTLPRLSTDERAALQQMASLSGAAFDAQFESFISAELQQEISLDQSEIQHGSNLVAISYARSQMAVDQRELQSLQSLQTGTATATPARITTHHTFNHTHHGTSVNLHQPPTGTSPLI
jgi:predicted outer membrane protein